MAKSTASALPQKRSARSLKIAGKRVSAKWLAGPAGAARGRRLAEQADSVDVATWRRSTERGFPQNRVAPGISKAGMRLGTTWQWAQVALNSSGSKMGASDAATWPKIDSGRMPANAICAGVKDYEGAGCCHVAGESRRRGVVPSVQFQTTA